MTAQEPLLTHAQPLPMTGVVHRTRTAQPELSVASGGGPHSLNLVASISPKDALLDVGSPRGFGDAGLRAGGRRGRPAAPRARAVASALGLYSYPP